MKFTKFFILFLALIAGLLIFTNFDRPDGKLHVYFFNVGQGDAIFIKGPEGQKILIDGGPDSTVLSELGENMSFYDREIDLLVLTHSDADHITGLLDVLKRYKIKAILESGLVDKSPEYEEWQKEIKDKNIQDKLAKRGEFIDLGQGIKMDVLSPVFYLVNTQMDNNNNSSIVLKLSDKHVSFLLTGDAEGEIGQEFLKDKVNIKSDIFKVSHHGSKNGLGNNDEILDKIKPEVAVISVGKNRFGHPDKKILNLLGQNHIKSLRTDRSGTIEVITDGSTYQIK